MKTSELAEMGLGRATEPAAEVYRHTFTLRDTVNIERADRVLRFMRIPHQVDERGAALIYSFFDEYAFKRAYRNVRLNINKAREGRNNWN